MKTKIFFFSFLITLSFFNMAEAKFPIHLGGFTLGEDISNYTHFINMKTCQQVPLNRYLGEAEIYRRQGFKSGIIGYGLCQKENKILRIKLKFSDSSKPFFNKLLSQYKKKLGAPDEYKGDSFQTMIAWKWSFKNERNQKTSLILQHNAMNEDEKTGNSVKLTLTSQIEKERGCFMRKASDKKSLPIQHKLSKKKLWDLFVPF
jgi:hypothetical protein